MTNRSENTAKTLRCALCSLGAATLLAVLSTLHLLHTSTTPVGWLRLGSRTQSSLRRSRRFVSWSSPCHPQGFFAGVTPEPGCPTRGTGRENPGGESLKKEHSEESLCHESGEFHYCFPPTGRVGGSFIPPKACADFSTSFAKKNFPSVGTIMICTLSLKRCATVNCTSIGFTFKADASSCIFSAPACAVTRIWFASASASKSFRCFSALPSITLACAAASAPRTVSSFCVAANNSRRCCSALLSITLACASASAFFTRADAAASASSIVVCLRASASRDRKSTRLNSSHITISYAVF